ncbi:hypothetical protein ACFSFY_09555 [Sporosarcina siberiensis]|uniref:Uncharacterized protein n=1 Tax=Sporosarcina siberiensis TaxID=1365606 RepID=A0ABW4SH20_9BACL
MTDLDKTEQSSEKKTKVSFKDAIKQQLEAKKNNQSSENSVTSGTLETKKMKSQQSKKVNNSHRKMGI